MTTFKFKDNISIQSFNDAWKENREEYISSFKQLFEPMFSVSQIGISRQELITWKKKGLIPERISSEKNWTRVNFFEYCWIRLIAEMRKMEIPLSVISLFKDVIHESDTEALFENFVGALDPNKESDLNPDFRETARNFLANMPEFLIEILKTYYNRFVQAILIFLFRGKEFSFLIRTDGMYLAFSPELMVDPDVKAAFEAFLQVPYYSIPVKCIFEEFFVNEKITSEERAEVFNLNERETKLIELLRKEGIKEVRIRLDSKTKKGIVFIEVVEEKQISEMKDKVRQILQKGKMQHIRIYSSEGNLLLFEETTQYKLTD